MNLKLIFSAALAAARTTPFDALVLDIMLPGRDGLSVLRPLRENKKTMPAIVILGGLVTSTLLNLLVLPVLALRFGKFQKAGAKK